jgi:hypothetical protein
VVELVVAVVVELAVLDALTPIPPVPPVLVEPLLFEEEPPPQAELTRMTLPKVRRSGVP